jgi:hypothetical protein
VTAEPGVVAAEEFEGENRTDAEAKSEQKHQPVGQWLATAGGQGAAACGGHLIEIKEEPGQPLSI